MTKLLGKMLYVGFALSLLFEISPTNSFASDPSPQILPNLNHNYRAAPALSPGVPTSSGRRRRSTAPVPGGRAPAAAASTRNPGALQFGGGAGAHRGGGGTGGGAECVVGALGCCAGLFCLDN